MENSPRTNTYAATSKILLIFFLFLTLFSYFCIKNIQSANCELLAVFNTNYKPILQPFMQKLWLEKKSALRALDYFNFLNEEQVSLF